MSMLSDGDMLNLPYKIVLASNSPRRKELLHGLGVDFTVRTIDGIDESWPEELTGPEIPIYISSQKADSYASSMTPEELVITADTIVYLDNRVYGKPKDDEDAKRMLRELSGKWHQVITGVTIVTVNKRKSFAVTTEVKFADFSEDEILYYVSKYSPMDKAGAYGIQEWIGFIGVEQIKGAYFNVVGLPVQRLYKELKDFSR
jgi:septum formation protein